VTLNDNDRNTGPRPRAIDAESAARQTDGRAKGTSFTELLRAREISGFTWSEPRLDIRGWQVYSHDAQVVGSVESLFVDMRTRVVRYLGVALSDPDTNLPLGMVLVPVGAAARCGDRRAIALSALSTAQLAAAPRIRSRPITRADEDATLAAYGMATSRDVHASDLYTGPNFSEQRLFE